MQQYGTPKYQQQARQQPAIDSRQLSHMIS